MGKERIITFLYGFIAALLLFCLFDMPYGFYTFVRFAVAAAFCYFAYKANIAGNKDQMILFLAFAVLFQPFLKIPLGRIIWNIVDVAIAVFLVCLLARNIKQNK